MSGDVRRGRFCFADPSWAVGYLGLDGEELLARWHGPDMAGSHERRLARWGLLLRRPLGPPELERVDVPPAEILPMP